ncbi:MAG: class I SAM-dependent methyltransferase [Candidatus Peribacteraceae bacterium]|nr:class I SAM-dependent methyltransferase [Candidatus Peribacteraceae bacterium]
MKQLDAVRRESVIPSHSPKGWEQIEDQEEVAHVLEKIRATTRFEVWHCAEQYEIAYPGYAGDKQYYLEKGKNGHVLYLGVGTGRIFGEMAKQNPDAVGLDSSQEMIDLLQRRHPHIREDQVLLADALDASLAENQFDTVVAPYSFLQVIEEEQLPQLLKNVRRWLKPKGRFSTDMFSSYLIPFRRKGLETSVRSVSADTRIAIYVLYDHAKQNMTEMALIDRNGDEKILEMRLHYYFPHEVLGALRSAGFENVSLTGGYNGEPFDPSENEVLVFEAQKAGPASNALPGGNGQRVPIGSGKRS